MRLFSADLLMMLGALFGLMAIPWTSYAVWALVIGAAAASAGLALDWRNGPRRLAYLGCLAIPWGPGLFAAPVLLVGAFAWRARNRSATAAR